MGLLEFKTPSENGLIASLIAGEAESVALVRRWIRAAAGRYRSLLADDLEDLEQDILVSLLNSLSHGSFRHDSKLETYVSRMVHYKCIDRIRGKARRTWVDLGSLELRAQDASALQKVEQRQDSRIAIAVAASLPEACRRLWNMIHAGKSYAEMAERVGVSKGTLRVRVLRCRRKAVEERDRMMCERGVQ